MQSGCFFQYVRSTLNMCKNLSGAYATFEMFAELVGLIPHASDANFESLDAIKMLLVFPKKMRVKFFV